MLGWMQGPSAPAQQEALAGTGLSGVPWCSRMYLTPRGRGDPAAGGKIPSSLLRPVDKEVLVCDAGQEREERKHFDNL